MLTGVSVNKKMSVTRSLQ